MGAAGRCGELITIFKPHKTRRKCFFVPGSTAHTSGPRRSDRDRRAALAWLADSGESFQHRSEVSEAGTFRRQVPLKVPLRHFLSFLNASRCFVFNGERARSRTWNLLIKSQLLYQLSYAPMLFGCKASAPAARSAGLNSNNLLAAFSTPPQAPSR